MLVSDALSDKENAIRKLTSRHMSVTTLEIPMEHLGQRILAKIVHYVFHVNVAALLLSGIVLYGNFEDIYLIFFTCPPKRTLFLIRKYLLLVPA